MNIFSFYFLQVKIEFMEYNGRTDLGKYLFERINHCTYDKLGRKRIVIEFMFKRPILNNFITIFVPTGIFLLISQISTAFSGTFKDMVIEVNTTLLLVLTT